MGLLWADNGNLYGPGLGSGIGGPVGGHLRALEGPYAEFSTVNGGMAADPDPTSNGESVFYFPAAAGARYDYYNPVLRRVLSTSKTTVGMFARLWWSSFSADRENGPMIRFSDNGNVSNIWLQVSPIGSIYVWQGIFNNSEPTLLDESAVCVTASAWHHIEAMVHFDDAAGTVEVRVNGITVIDLSGVDTVTTNANCQNVCLGNRCTGTAGGGAVYWKDFVIWDTSGTVNNDFFGTCAVEAIMPDGDDTLTWTPSSGAVGYSLIDETNGPNDAGYIQAGLPPIATNVFTMENLPADITSVRGLMIMTRVAKTDGGDCQVQAGVLSNGTAGLGTDRAITTAFTYWMDVVELDPDTGFQFTPIGFNAAKLTIDRTV